MSATAAAEPTAARASAEAERSADISLIGRWVLRIGAFLLPLVFIPDIVDEFVLPKLLLTRVLVMILIVLLVFRWLRHGAISWRRTPLDLPLLAFIGSAALSTIFAINRNVAIFGTYTRWEGLLTIVTYALVFWLAVQFLSDEPDARGLTWSLLSSGYLIGGIAVLQSAFGLFGGGDVPGTIGAVRASATLANPDFAGIFLAMLLPVALAKVLSQRPVTTRVLAANLVVVLFLGLLVTFTRAAWIGAIVGVVTLLVLRRGRFHVWPLVISASLVVVAFAVVGGIAATRPPTTSQGGIGSAIIARAVSIPDLRSSTEAVRLSVWADTLPLIASRPVIGYGPDTFGLIYPQYQSASRSRVLWDKPHQEALGVAAAQGLVGLAAYIWILVAFVRAFWKGRFLRGAVALFAGWIAYMVSIQADFSWIPTSVPFWFFAAAAIVTWAPHVESVRVAEFPQRIAIPAMSGASMLLVVLLVPAVVLPYLADAKYAAALNPPDLNQARAAMAQARALAPNEAIYAIEAGNYALNLDQNGNPASNADWSAAREAYQTAARLGSFSPEMFQELALVDEHFGDHAGAVAAATRALELDRYDPGSQLLLKRLTGQ